MDLLWVSVGFGLFIVFLFCIFAQHFSRVLTRCARTIQQTNDRLSVVEEVANPELIQTLENGAPSSLNSVCTFTLRFNETFWKDTVKVSSGMMEFIQQRGTMLGSVKIEQWDSHAAVTVAEMLPQSRGAVWQNRCFTIYPEPSLMNAGVLLWRLPFKNPAIDSSEATTGGIELRLEGNALALYAVRDLIEVAGRNRELGGHADLLLLNVPLNPKLLSNYRTASTPGNDDPWEAFSVAEAMFEGSGSRVVIFAHEDKHQGLDWHLCLREINRHREPHAGSVLQANEWQQVR
jgi:hypothetical protein